MERLPSSWSHHVVAELPPSQDKEEEDKDKEEEEEDEEKEEEEAIIALALQHTQRICYISAVTMQTRHVLPKVTNQTPTSPNLDFG